MWARPPAMSTCHSAWHESGVTARLPLVFALIRAAHPEPAAAVTLASGLLALAVGHPPARAAVVTATVAASQLAVGWSNDALDAGRDAAVGRTDKPAATRAVSRRTLAGAAVVAAAGTLLLATGLGRPAAAAAAIGLAGGCAYNWPLKFTVLSPVPYAVAFAALPAFVVLALPATPPGWLVVAGGLLGAGAHFANALPDLADDAATGVRGLPHRLGATGAAAAAAGLLLAATGVLVVGPAGPPSTAGFAALVVAAVVLPAGWYADRRSHRARPTYQFRAFLAVGLVAVVLLLAGGTLTR